MYLPAEDSIFFADFLKDYFSRLKNKNIFYLDMGSGSGILSEIARKSNIKNIFAADIDDESIKFVRKKGLTIIKSDFFSKISKNQKFDIITFNAPYLPNHKFDKKPDTSGGKRGDEASLRFLRQAKAHLNKGGRIFLLISSLTPYNKIEKFNPKIVARKKLFFEELLILEFGNSN
ncbi:MAG: methyltransferase [Nanoarchaeota archaeon]|nr:methyltransferase [Nanoarchaeota archaeon]